MAPHYHMGVRTLHQTRRVPTRRLLSVFINVPASVSPWSSSLGNYIPGKVLKSMLVAFKLMNCATSCQCGTEIPSGNQVADSLCGSDCVNSQRQVLVISGIDGYNGSSMADGYVASLAILLSLLSAVVEIQITLYISTQTWLDVMSLIFLPHQPARLILFRRMDLRRFCIPRRRQLMLVQRLLLRTHRALRLIFPETICTLCWAATEGLLASQLFQGILTQIVPT
jgi:hypothetical protein